MSKGKKVVITGVPGVGKTTVIDSSLEALKEEGVNYTSINFGTCMFEVACDQGIVNDRDEMRKLDQELQRALQKTAAQVIAKIQDNVIIDTHCTVSTPHGYLAGLPSWVLQELNPDIIVLVETDEDQILKRRLSDTSRTRDMEGYSTIKDHQRFNRYMAASYAMMTGCTVKIVKNLDFLLENAVGEMVALLR
ncbi:adenylate kinase [Methanoplanus sp. FWC-SCC4]|uniref:Adenylate kinase n=1 Tax=Methanochimaera problematica TaxID=2609417 RepID=A0AA97I3E0_9EURY|nr:adenylate kinase [Methanoplanus sp. FWC-SCC4]WOF15494.1 adenylate kinase [Methanoplanus sp. FWC-SCC4]